MDKKTQLKALHIASGDLWAGAEVQLFTLAKTLHTRSDVIVEIVLLNHGRLEHELRSTGIDVTVIDESRLNGIRILIQLIAVIRKSSPDIVHTHRLKENILGSIAATIAGNFRSIRTIHGAPEHPYAWYQLVNHLIVFLDWICGRYIQQRIVAVSDDLKNILKKSYPSEKIQVISNGIDVDALSQFVKFEKNNAKAGKTNYRIGIAGRLVPVKRIDLFIKTAELLLIDNHELNLSFHIYGDGPLRNKLEMLSRELGIDSHVHFEGHCDNIYYKLQHLNLLLMTSDHEGLPMIILEAMVLGVPVVAHAVGGISQVLDQGACGVLVKKQFPEEYARKTQCIMNNSNHYLEIKKKAQLRVKETYSADRNARQYFDLYIECVEH